MQKNSFIGDIKNLTPNKSALSIVRKDGKEHVFLVLETIDYNDNRLIYNTHLVKKEESHGTKALVVFKENVLPVDLLEYSENCNSLTWAISKDQTIALLELIKLERERAAVGEINYLLVGDAPLLASIAGCMQHVTSDSVADNVDAWYQKYQQNTKQKENEITSQVVSHESIRSLCVNGHNCLSWTLAIITAIGIKNIPNKFKKCLVTVNPNDLQGKYTLEEPKNSGGCQLM